MAKSKKVTQKDLEGPLPAPFTYNNVVLAKALKDRDFDVLDNMINLYRNSRTISDRDRIAMLEKLLPFLIPKLATVEVTGEGAKPSVIQIIYKNEEIKTIDDN
jgi:hypothetical protein